MQRHALRPLSVVVCLSLLLLTTVILWPAQSAVSAASGAGAGSLGIIGKDGSVKSACPLRHTEVRGAITGFLARVTVTQIFENTAAQRIEAVYAFPLPDNAAVDDMTIQVGTRTVRGVIRKREEARAIYEKARQTGHVAALLDQERPNIFTQSVANILPGEQITVTISYLQTLEYENGAYQFVFPMVVGPRYIPGQPTGKQAGGWAPDTTRVPDASKITPPITLPGTRTGHDISIELAIDAGVPLLQLSSSSHEIDVDRISASSADVKLKNLAEIPNKDFVLKYDVAGEQIADAVLSQADSQVVSRAKSAAGGYFTLILQPPARLPESDITPKELVFVLDTSGSMMGFPIAKAKELINPALDELYPGDTFNLITFSGDTRILFPEPVYPTAENIRKAREVLNAQHGYGGTEMMTAIRAALAPSDSQDHLRVVCFLTDGYVGNDLEIIAEVQHHPNARVFAYGIGNAVNRFLIESMARAGRGDSEVVMLNDKADDAAHRLYQRLRSPVLTDVSIDWRNLPVNDVFPKKLPDLFTGNPLVVSGRYTAAADGSIVIHGKRAGEDFTREIPVHLNRSATADRTLSTFWARRKIDDLMSQDWAGLQAGTVKPEVQNQITQLGLNYNLMTQFTSFVAVEERVVTTNGKPQRVEVPVEMPQGVSYEGIFGGEKDALLYAPRAGFAAYAQNSKALRISGGGGIAMRKMAAPPPVLAPNAGIASGSGGGIGSGSGAGTGPGVAFSQPQSPTKGPAHGETPAFDRLDNYAPGAQSPDAKPATDRALLESKLSPAVLDTFACWSKRSSACNIAPDGTIEIQLFLTDDSPAVVDQLKSLGLLLSQARTKDKVITGRLPVEKLLALAGMESVKFVAPIRR
ncbi:MAG TPA: VIT and VWA domain-containing protein [Candidatus Sulfotelmatobacter sp.]|nr:VIT and VWA domain-containing protein [Candidatus Sulfotelmatobacter sp.]